MTVTYRLLVPILVGIAVAIAALTLISVNSQQSLIAQREDTQLAEAYSGFYAQAGDQARLAQALASSVSRLPDAGREFAGGDPARLLQVVNPLYRELDNQYDIPELNFYSRPSTVFLRVAQPAQRDDDVSGYRPIVVRAIRSGLPQSGIEVGQAGPRFYSAVPLIYSGNYLGALEVGMALDRKFLEQYKSRWHVDVALYVKHSVYLRANPNASAASGNLAFPDLELVALTGDAVRAPETVYGQALGGKTAIDRITQGSASYAVQAGPLVDYSGDTIGVVQFVLPRAAVLGAIDNSRNTSILWGSVIFLLVILAVYVATNRLVIRPLAHLTQVADAFRGGNRTARSNLKIRDELGRLGTTLNSMADEIVGLVSGLEQRVADRTASLERYSNYMVALQDTTTDLISRRDVDDLLQLIVARAGGLVGTEHGYVFLLDPKTGEMIMRVGVGTYTNLVGTRARPGVGLAGTAWQSGAPVIVEDYQHWPGRLAGSERSVLKAVAGVPLKVGNQVVGVIGLAYLDPARRFGENEAEVLDRFAQFASVALQNAQLYAEQKALAEENQKGFEREAALARENRLSAERAAALAEDNRESAERAVALAEENRQSAERAAALAEENRSLLERAQAANDELNALTRRLTGQSWQEFVAATPRTLVGQASRADLHQSISSDTVLHQALEKRELTTTAENGRTALAVPIMLRGEALGAIAIEDNTTRGAWDAEEVAAVQGVAERVALAMENARLFEQTLAALAEIRKQADRETKLAAINDRIYGTTDIQGILRIATEELRRATGSSRAVVHLGRKDGTS